MNTVIKFGLLLLFFSLITLLISLTPDSKHRYCLRIERSIENYDGHKKELFQEFCYFFFKSLEESEVLKISKESLEIIKKLKIYERKNATLPNRLFISGNPDCIFKESIAELKNDSLLLNIKIIPSQSSNDIIIFKGNGIFSKNNTGGWYNNIMVMIENMMKSEKTSE